MPVNRLVAFIVGPVITLASGYISLFLAKNIPGLHITQSGVAGVLTTGSITLLPMLLAHLKVQKWLDGWQKWEHQANELTNGALDANLKLFLERLAVKTGVPLPSGEVLVEADVVGAGVPPTPPVAPSEPSGDPEPPQAAPAAEETGDVFTEPPAALTPGAFAPPPAQQQQ